MKRCFLVLFTLNFLVLQASAQKEANMWYFGDKCAVDFSYGYPIAQNKNVMTVSEGSASLCDVRGYFLFYTNGVRVFTREHKEMPNAKNLKGHDSSTQSALPVPKPGNINQVYLFTADAGAYDSPPNNGIHYTLIDMTRNNGLGDAAQKNVLLLPVATEKLTAVKHANGKDVWVVAHGWQTNNFYAWLVSKNGVAKLPVLSTIGAVHRGGRAPETNGIGQMKLSPDGKRLALAMFDENFFEVFDFDNATGTVSNCRSVFLPTAGKDDQQFNAYGVEFSPDGSKLYIGQYWKSRVYQYDPSLPSGAQMMVDAALVGESTDRKFGAMQLAPDGKIYITKESRYLGVINNPNLSGTDCDFENNGFDVKYGRPQLGLPAFVQSYFYRPLR